jgi:hypothetical protein
MLKLAREKAAAARHVILLKERRTGSWFSTNQ